MASAPVCARAAEPGAIASRQAKPTMPLTRGFNDAERAQIKVMAAPSRLAPLDAKRRSPVLCVELFHHFDSHGNGARSWCAVSDTCYDCRAVRLPSPRLRGEGNIHRARTKLGPVRGRFHELRLAARPPHPDLLSRSPIY